MLYRGGIFLDHEGALMAYSNVTAEFDQIPERAGTASQQLHNAATATRDQLDRELADARARAAADAGRLKARADEARSDASSIASSANSIASDA